MQSLALILLASLVLFLLIYLCSAWMSGMISGEYFDKKLQEQGLSLIYIFSAGFSKRCTRAGVYLLLVLLNGNPCINHNCRWYPRFLTKRYHQAFGKTDFRLLARTQDWILAFILWGSCLAFILCALASCLLAAYLHITGVI